MNQTVAQESPALNSLETARLQLQTLLHRETPAQLFALIDAGPVPDAHQFVRWMKHMDAVCLFGQLQEADQETLAPWLLNLTSQSGNQTVSDKLLDLAHQTGGVTWLQSTLPLTRLAARLQSRLTVTIDDREALLRYYDPWVLPGLYSGLTGQAHLDFFAVGNAWLYLDDDDALCTLGLPGAAPQDSLEKLLALPEAAVDVLMDQAELRQLIATLAADDPRAFLRLSRGSRLRLASAAQNLARLWRLDGFLATAGIGRLMLLAGVDQVTSDPAWRSQATAAGNNQSSWQQLIANAHEQIKRGSA